MNEDNIKQIEKEYQENLELLKLKNEQLTAGLKEIRILYEQLKREYDKLKLMIETKE